MDLVALCEKTLRTLREVLDLHAPDVVAVSFYEMVVGPPEFAPTVVECA